MYPLVTWVQTDLDEIAIDLFDNFNNLDTELLEDLVNWQTTFHEQLISEIWIITADE